MIFVFGSNLAGRHGKGAALTALKKHGAIYGQAVGLQGQSYAIPTKDERIRTLPLDWIEMYVRGFVWYAGHHKELQFNVTPIGCGLAGYTPFDIAPMFESCLNLPNVRLCDPFYNYLTKDKSPISGALW